MSIGGGQIACQEGWKFAKMNAMELSELKGVGKVRLAKLNAAGIFSVADLVNYLPIKYYNFENVGYFAEDGLPKVLLAMCAGEPKVVRARGLNYCTVKMQDDGGNYFNAVWYNQPYMAQNICLGKKYFLYGKNSEKKKKTFIVSLCKSQDKLSSPYLAVYKKIDGFGGQPLANLISEALAEYTPSSLIGQDLEQKYNLIGLKQAYFSVHQPASEKDYLCGKERIDVERLLPLAAKNKYKQVFKSGNRNYVYPDIAELRAEFEKLPAFKLTADQSRVLDEICQDLELDKSMNRLLQGEVGSGKTIVAFFCAYVAAKCGYQAAIVAPTEILASQHFAAIGKLLQGCGINILHLTGSLSAAQKRECLRQIKLGIAQIVVGTHAVLSSSVCFKNLAMAIIDEQHRFGVSQRAKLSQKGNFCDVLVLSATPIPRSMALAIYGELSLSVITNCPFAKKITTNLITPAKQPDMWQYILQKTKNGARVFVVCGQIGEEDADDASAKATFAMLKNIFGAASVGLLHGKLSKDTASKIMQDFAAGKFSVLVATTIVEVGVDIPEAEIMVIASPEKFGLATLHQLRGRVGRAGTQSYCFCLVGDISPKTAERLKFFRDHSSGFDIAEYDYASRGAGDMWGTSQHGISVSSTVNMRYYALAQQIVEDKTLSKTALETMLLRADAAFSKICSDIALN